MAIENPTLSQKFDCLKDAVIWASRESNTAWGLQAGPREREPNESWVQLDLLRISGIGSDENRYEDIDGDFPADLTVVGQRLLKIQVTCFSRNNEHSFAAYTLAENTKGRLSAPFAAENWYSDGCIAFSDATDVINTPDGVTVDNRDESKAIFELSFLTVVTQTDEAFASSFIENIEVTSDLKVSGDASLDESLQLDEELIP